MSEQKQQPEKKKKKSRGVTCIVIGISLVIIYLCINFGTVALFGDDDAEPETPINEKITVEAKPTEAVIEKPTEAPINTPTPEPSDTPIPIPSDTSIPALTTWVGVIDCPECIEGDTFILWAEVDDIGYDSPEVMYGDICTVIDKGVTEGVEKYKLDCDGKIGWLRAEGVIPADQTTEPDHVLIDPGTYVVGEDIEPGIYQGETVDHCYWERLSDFSGELSGTIANGGGGEPGSKFYVEVMETDFAFYTSCPLVSFTPKEK